MEGLRFVTYSTKPEVDLANIHAGILKVPTMLHPSLEELEGSYVSSRAVVMVDDGKEVGFIRYTPLLDQGLKKKLRLDPLMPDIWEIGSAFITDNPKYRGNGNYPHLRAELLRVKQSEILRGELLVLGTSKLKRVLEVLPEARDLGIDFYPCIHTEFPMIAPFTCVCSGDFGQGYQLNIDCPARVNEEFIADFRLKGMESLDGKKLNPCIMYVSSKKLAKETDISLLRLFRSQQSLVSALKRVTYYG